MLCYNILHNISRKIRLRNRNNVCASYIKYKCESSGGKNTLEH